MKTTLVLTALLSVLLFPGCKDQESEVPRSDSSIKFNLKDGSERISRTINTSDGGFAFVGSVGGDAFIYKTDAEGNELWYHKVVGGKQDVFLNVVETQDGDLIAVGATASGEYGVVNDYTDALLVRYSSSGSKIWEKTYGTDKTDFLDCIKEDRDGNFITAGGTAPSNVQTWLLKLNGNGDLIWEQQYYVGEWHSLVKDITFTPGGDYVIWGMMSPSGIVTETRKYLTFRAILYRSDGSPASNGTVYDQYQRSSGLSDAINHKLRAIQSGNEVYWINVMVGLSGEDYAILVKTDQNGNVISDRKIFRGEGFTFKEIILDDNGEIFVIGGVGDFGLGFSAQNSVGALVKLNTSGDVEWNKYYGNALGYQSIHSCYPDGDELKVTGFLFSSQTGRGMFMYFKADDHGEIKQ